MCHFTVNLNTCGHLSQCYKNVQRCHQLSTQCRINPNGQSSSAARLKELMSSDFKGKEALKPRELLFTDRKRQSLVTIDINSETACSKCQPVAYARFMEREEGSEHKSFVQKDAEAQKKTVEAMGGIMEELDKMIQEGYRRGWAEEVQKLKDEAGLRNRGKQLEKHVTIVLPVVTIEDESVEH